jgi:hypothetical protein
VWKGSNEELVVSVHAMAGTVASGQKRTCEEKCSGFSWNMQGKEFKWATPFYGVL